MRVIKPGNSTPEEEVWCEYCHALLCFTKSDVRRRIDDYDITEYYITCPECGHKQSVSAWARPWFE